MSFQLILFFKFMICCSAVLRSYAHPIFASTDINEGLAASADDEIVFNDFLSLYSNKRSLSIAATLQPATSHPPLPEFSPNATPAPAADWQSLFNHLRRLAQALWDVSKAAVDYFPERDGCKPVVIRLSITGALVGLIFLAVMLVLKKLLMACVFQKKLHAEQEGPKLRTHLPNFIAYCILNWQSTR